MISLALLLFAWSAYDSRYTLNPDGISYISIARQYADGHFYSALSTLMPPLLSWLLIPLLKLGISGQMAFRLLNILIAASILLIGLLFIFKQTKRRMIALFFGTLVTPFLIYAVGYAITPDLLVVLWVLIFYLSLLKADKWLQEEDRAHQLKAGVLLGVIGAIGYFTKQFIFPFFFGSLFLWAGWRLLARRDGIRRLPTTPVRNIKQTIGYLSITLMVFGIVSAPWVLAISIKHGGFTVGTSIGATLARFEESFSVTAVSSASQITLLDPPSQYAVSYQECRGCFKSQPVYTTNNEDGFNLGHFISKKTKSIPPYLRRLNKFNWFILPVAALWLFLVASKKLTYKKHTSEIIAGVLFMVYLLGYAVTLSEKATYSTIRYLWPTFIMGGLLMGLLLSRATNLIKKPEAPLLRLVVLSIGIIVAGSSLLRYRLVIADLASAPSKSALQVIAEDLQANQIIPHGAKLASNSRRPTLRLAYYLGAQTYGAIARDESGPKFTDPEVQTVLENKGIDYYFHYSATAPVDLGINGAQVIKHYPVQTACQNDLGAKVENCILTVVKLGF